MHDRLTDDANAATGVASHCALGHTRSPRLSIVSTFLLYFGPLGDIQRWRQSFNYVKRLQDFFLTTVIKIMPFFIILKNERVSFLL